MRLFPVRRRALRFSLLPLRFGYRLFTASLEYFARGVAVFSTRPEFVSLPPVSTELMRPISARAGNFPETASEIGTHARGEIDPSFICERPN